MISLNQIKTGDLIELDGKPYRVLFSQHSKLGRGGAILRTKLKNLINGSILSKTFKGDTELDYAQLDKTTAQFLYSEGENYNFMDSQTYEQFTLTKAQIGKGADFLVEGAQISILSYDERPVSVDLPIKINLKVTDAEPGVKGDSATAPTKNITLESGAIIKGPIFIKEDDIVTIDIRTGKYVGRV